MRSPTSTTPSPSAAFASFTRIDGVFLVAGLAVAVAIERRRRGAPFVLRSLGTLAIGLTGLVAYWGALWAWTGNPAEWFAAERAGWHRSLNWPWVSLSNTVGTIIFGVLFFGFCIGFVWMVWRNRDKDKKKE